MTAVAVLGTGYMGGPMARNIIASAYEVRVWNRTPERAAPLAEEGATVASSPAEAVENADIMVTVLADGPTVEHVVRQAASALKPGVLWLQMSTVGIEWTRNLADVADELDVVFVDAPVLGTRKPAQAGELTVLAAGTPELRARAQPIFDAVGSRTIWLDQPGDASRLKVVTNAWILSLTAVLAESVSLAEHLGLEPQRFLEAIEGGAVGAPYAQIKGQLMLDDDYPPSFPIRLARKDARLVVDAAEAHDLHLSLATAAAERYADAVEQGHGELDMAAIRRVM